jgi:hypothetical protein
MSIIEQITGRELERAITLAFRPYVAWYDGTAETGRTSFVEFAAIMERFAIHLRPEARVVLVNVEVWDGTSARFTVIGCPKLVNFKGSRKIAHQIGPPRFRGYCCAPILIWQARRLRSRGRLCGAKRNRPLRLRRMRARQRRSLTTPAYGSATRTNCGGSMSFVTVGTAISAQRLTACNAIQSAGKNTALMIDLFGGGNPGSLGANGGLTVRTYASMTSVT